MSGNPTTPQMIRSLASRLLRIFHSQPILETKPLEARLLENGDDPVILTMLTRTRLLWEPIFSSHFRDQLFERHGWQSWEEMEAHVTKWIEQQGLTPFPILSLPYTPQTSRDPPLSLRSLW